MDNPLKTGQVVAGKYVVERLLGSGGMGVVVGARHVVLGAPRAIKVPYQGGAAPTDLAEQALREAQLGAQLSGEHVVRIHDAGLLDDGVPYLVMEHLEGQNLAQVLRERGPLPAALAALYVMQACAGLEEAHALGIVHGDLKPANLFLTARSDGSPCVKVFDFGIARSLGTAAPSGKHWVEGSPAYMAPERALPGPVVDTRADVWALGVVLYELLTGHPPFVGHTLAATLSLVLNREPPPARALVPDLPAGLDAILSRCLQKSPARRFQNVRELRDALCPFASAGDPALDAPRPGGDDASGTAAREHLAAAETSPSPTRPEDVTTFPLRPRLPAASPGEPHRRVAWTSWVARAGTLLHPGADPIQTVVAAGLGALRRYASHRFSGLRRAAG